MWQTTITQILAFLIWTWTRIGIWDIGIWIWSFKFSITFIFKRSKFSGVTPPVCPGVVCVVSVCSCLSLPPSDLRNRLSPVPSEESGSQSPAPDSGKSPFLPLSLTLHSNSQTFILWTLSCFSFHSTFWLWQHKANKFFTSSHRGNLCKLVIWISLLTSPRSNPNPKSKDLGCH